MGLEKLMAEKNPLMSADDQDINGISKGSPVGERLSPRIGCSSSHTECMKDLWGFP